MDYMRRNGSRTIKVDKGDLIDQIEINKQAHIVAYDKAVIAYKAEALKQLKVQIHRVNDGELDARINLTTPVNNVENYDKIIKMFQWEKSAEVDLTQDEYNEYVEDETEVSRHAMMSNTMYLG
jgi:heme oxygenase